MEEEQDDDAPDQVAIAEDEMFEMRPRCCDGHEQGCEERKIGGHQSSCDEEKCYAGGDGERRIENADAQEAGRVEAVRDPRREEMAGRKHPEDFVVEGFPVEQLHGRVEWPAFVHGAQAMLDEERFESDAHGQQNQEMDEELAVDGAG